MAEHDSQHEPVQVHGTGNPLRCQGLFHQGLEPEFLQHRDHRQQSAVGRQILPVEVIGRGGTDFIGLRRSLSGALFRGAFIAMLISVRHHLGDLLRVDSAKRQLRDSALQPNYLRGPQMVRYASTFRRALAKVHKSRATLGLAFTSNGDDSSASVPAAAFKKNPLDCCRYRRTPLACAARNKLPPPSILSFLSPAAYFGISLCSFGSEV